MGDITEFTDTSMQFVYGVDHETEKVTFRFLVPVHLIHSCTETHTYILQHHPTSVRGPLSDLGYDLFQLDNTPLPFGQIVILSYYGDGKFLIEAATERFKPHLVKKAFQSFGYTNIRIKSDFVSVSGKDHFKLKLKFGI